jgi:hypothetical protein
MDGELYERLRKVERAVEVILDLLPSARERLRPRDAMAICDDKGILKPGPLGLTVDELGRIVWTSPPSS